MLNFIKKIKEAIKEFEMGNDYWAWKKKRSSERYFCRYCGDEKDSIYSYCSNCMDV